MKTSRATSMAWLLVAPTLLGCSLMGLDDFRQQRCVSDADCLRAQSAFGDAARCDFYVCQQGTCVPQHGTETCNDASIAAFARRQEIFGIMPNAKDFRFEYREYF